MKQKHYMISDAAKKVDVESHVLRYWEEELSLPIARNEMGHRCYTEENILLFQNIKCLKEQGFALKAIRLLLPELTKRTPKSLANLFLIRAELNRRAEEIDIAQDTTAQTASATSAQTAKAKVHAMPAVRANTPASSEKDVKKAAQETAQSTANPSVQADGTDAADELPAAPTSAELKLQQFQSLVGDVVRQAVSDSVGDVFRQQVQNGVRQAISENNRRLVQDMSRQLSCDICEDLDGLLQEHAQRNEERYHALDAAIRERQRMQREAAAVSLDKLRKQKRRFFQKKNRTAASGGKRHL